MDPPPHECLVLALEQLYALGALNHLGELTKVNITLGAAGWVNTIDILVYLRSRQPTTIYDKTTALFFDEKF